MSVRTTDMLDEGRIVFREPEGNEPVSKEWASTAQVIDPVCGMEVEPQRPDTEKTERSGTMYYFCSRACKERFEQNPEEFITAL